MFIWHPWRELRARPHLLLEWAHLSEGDGRIEDNGDGTRTITLDCRLDQRHRRAVLAHELVHDELDLLWAPGTPQCIVGRGERIVDAVVADRLVPVELLSQFIYAYSELEGVTCRVVAEEFNVPIVVADLALQRAVAGF